MQGKHRLSLKSKQGEMEVEAFEGSTGYYSVEDEKEIDRLKHFLTRHHNKEGTSHLNAIEYFIDKKKVTPKDLSFNKAVTKFLIQTI